MMLKNEGINKENIQIKNRCNDLRNKLGAWEFLIGKIGVGVDNKTSAVVVSDSTWQDFLQVNDIPINKFRILYMTLFFGIVMSNIHVCGGV